MACGARQKKSAFRRPLTGFRAGHPLPPGLHNLDAIVFCLVFQSPIKLYALNIGPVFAELEQVLQNGIDASIAVYVPSYPEFSHIQ
jgi:hypothetical protein